MKLAVFWQFSQLNPEWEEIYYKPTFDKIVKSGLYDEIEFINYYIKGNQLVENPPDKLNNFHMFGNINEKYKEVAPFWVDKIVNWSKENLGYKILLIHDIGIIGKYGHAVWGNEKTDIQSSKKRFNNWLERVSIEEWKLSVDLLDYHDVVGAIWHNEAYFRNQQTDEYDEYPHPHFHGGPYYWTTSDYFSTLDTSFLYQQVDWQVYCGELLIGTNNPNFYSFCPPSTEVRGEPFNHYFDDVDEVFNFDELKQNTIDYLKIKKITNDDMPNKKNKVLLSTMFKNEEKGILRMMESWDGLFDYWVFQNNGCTDNTVNIVTKYMKEKNIPGFIYEVEEGWKGFGWNRDHLFQKIQSIDHDCDWIVKYDCDEYLEVKEGFNWDGLNTKTKSYAMCAELNSNYYYKTMIFNTKFKWGFEHDPAHEMSYLISDNGDKIKGDDWGTENFTSDLVTIGTRDGESYTNPFKYIIDANKLETKLYETETFHTDTYHTYYLAKSYWDGAVYSDGNIFPYGSEHKKHYIDNALFYYKQWLIKNAMHDEISEDAYLAYLYIGEIYHREESHKDLYEALKWYENGQKHAPPRNQTLIRRAEVYEELGDYKKMLELTTEIVDAGRTNPFPQFYLCVNKNHYYDTGDFVHQLHGRALQLVEDNKEKPNFNINNSFDKRIFVVDNFYENPYAVREHALKMEFKDDLDWYKGKRTEEQIIYPNTKETFEKIIGQKIVNWSNEYGMCGVFQSCNAEDALVYHYDEQQFAGMVYLTPGAPYQCGTSLWAHKDTDIRHTSQDSDDIAFSGGFYDRTKFDLVDVVGNVFNRLVIFNGKCIHSASEYFGQTIEDSRLFHMFFFD